MKVIQSPNPIITDINTTKIFLAGHANNWDQMVELLSLSNHELTLFNPLNKSNHKWETQAISQSDVYALWLSKSDHKHNYTIGRVLTLYQYFQKPIPIIGVESGCKIQELKQQIAQIPSISDEIISNISSSLEQHAQNIMQSILESYALAA